MFHLSIRSNSEFQAYSNTGLSGCFGKIYTFCALGQWNVSHQAMPDGRQYLQQCLMWLKSLVQHFLNTDSTFKFSIYDENGVVFHMQCFFDLCGSLSTSSILHIFFSQLWKGSTSSNSFTPDFMLNIILLTKLRGKLFIYLPMPTNAQIKPTLSALCLIITATHLKASTFLDLICQPKIFLLLHFSFQSLTQLLAVHIFRDIFLFQPLNIRYFVDKKCYHSCL